MNDIKVIEQRQAEESKNQVERVMGREGGSSSMGSSIQSQKEQDSSIIAQKE